ncbi:MAG: DUF3333 domain-containing protein, partial [Pseudomonadota bacterium]
MTDILQPDPTVPDNQPVVSADRRRALHSKRYSSEARFKYLGLSAILVSVAFLVMLLLTVIGSGIPAFTYHYLNLPVDMSGVDAGDPETGDYDGIVRSGIGEAMPYLSGRKGKRLARGMVSGGAAIELRRDMVSSPEQYKDATTYGVPVSDFADLYLKGLTASNTPEKPETQITVSEKSGSVEFKAGDDVFQEYLASVKLSLGNQADLVRKRMEAIQRSLDQQLSIEANATDQAVIDAAVAQVEQLEAKITAVKKQFDALIARKDATNAMEALDQSMPSLLLRLGGGTIKITEIDANSGKGDVIIPLASTSADAGEWEMQTISDPEENRKFSDREIAVMDKLQANGLIESRWNSIFFTKGASREPELAGIWGAVVGSFFTMVITLLLSFPLGVAAAIYLEEFAPKNRFTQLIEVNIEHPESWTGPRTALQDLFPADKADVHALYVLPAFG